MTSLSYALFSTPLGACGVAWTSDGIARVQLPEKDTVATEMRLSDRARLAPPPPFVQQAMEKIISHLHGRPQDFSEVPLDWSGVSPFYRKVYEAARHIPPGQTRAYRDLAETVGLGSAARAVGQAMARNPMPILIPCHRVTSRDARGGGFSAHGGLTTKARLLHLEGGSLPTGAVTPPSNALSLWHPGVLEAGLETLRRKDPRLSPLLDAVGPCGLRSEHAGEPFAALVESVIYQQLAGKAAAAIVRRFLTLFDGQWPAPEQVLNTPDEVLRGAGLSTAKIAAIRSLSTAVTVDGLDLDALSQAPETDIRTALTALKGIGPWTVDMFLIFHLGRPDVLPVGDLGVRKAVQQLYHLRQLPEPARMEKLTTRWKPYRTIGTWYLWRSLGIVTLGATPG